MQRSMTAKIRPRSGAERVVVVEEAAEDDDVEALAEMKPTCTRTSPETVERERDDRMRCQTGCKGARVSGCSQEMSELLTLLLSSSSPTGGTPPTQSCCEPHASARPMLTSPRYSRPTRSLSHSTISMRSRPKPAESYTLTSSLASLLPSKTGFRFLCTAGLVICGRSSRSVST